MRRALLLGVVLTFAWCGVSEATDYYWVGTGTTNSSTTSYWDQAANWVLLDNTSNGSYPQLSTDRALFTSPLLTSTRYARIRSNQELVVGEIQMGTRGSISWYSASNSTLTVTDNGGLSGSIFNHSSSTTYAVNDSMIVYGDFSYLGGGSGVPLTMRGEDKYLRTTPDSNRGFGVDLYIDGGKVYDNHTATPNHIRQYRDVTIMNGGEWAAGASYGATDLFLDCRNITILPSGGSITGSVRLVDQGYDNGTYRQSNIQGGVTYGRDLLLHTSYSGSIPSSDSWFERTIRGGDMTVGRNLNFSSVGGEQARSYRLTLQTLDNGVSRDIHVIGNLNLGSSGTAKVGYLIECNDSAIDIDGDVNISPTAYRTNTNSGYGTGALHMGTSTIRVGGNWFNNRRFDTATKLYDATRYIESAWDPGTSTVIFDGNGTVKTQTFYPDNLPFYTVIIDAPGTVRLNPGTGTRDRQDLLIIHGDFKVLNGIFQQNNKSITFNGPEHLFEDMTGAVDFDNINLAPGAVVVLGSDINIGVPDNLNMGAGAMLYLNGHTLTADGIDYVDGDQSFWTNDGGMILSGAAAIPEPTTLLLLGTGLLGALGYARRRRMT